jgi:hypothetical protein
MLGRARVIVGTADLMIPASSGKMLDNVGKYTAPLIYSPSIRK